MTDTKIEHPAPPSLGSGETAAIPYEILKRSSTSKVRDIWVRERLLRTLEDAMVNKEGYIDWGKLDQPEQTCLTYWNRIHFVEYEKVATLPVYCSPPTWATHQVAFTPEAWELAQRARRNRCGTLTLPSVKTYDECSEVKGPHGQYVREHPAYGQLTVHRVSGSNLTLYGSDFKHSSAIELVLKGSRVERGLNKNWFYGSKCKFEVLLSESQWATLLCSLNQGGGVPCTIQFDGRKLPDCPYTPEVLDFRQELEGDVSDVATTLQTLVSKVEELRSQKRVTKKELQELHRVASWVEKCVVDRLPFLKKQYEKAMSRSTEAARREIQAAMDMARTLEGKSTLALPEPGEDQ